MLERVNGLSKNAIILFSILTLAITAIIITVILSGGGSSKPSAKSLKDFEEYIVKEYGVQPDISVNIFRLSDNQAETLTKSLAKELKLNEPTYEEHKDTKWYQATNEDGNIDINATLDR